MRPPRAPRPASLAEVVARAKLITDGPSAEALELERDIATQDRADRLRALDAAINAEDFDRLVRRELLETRYVIAMRGWMSEPNSPVLVLSGTVGRGKTLAAVDGALHRTGSRYIRARVAERLSAARFGADARDWALALACPGVLVLDDIGRERDPVELTTALLDVLDDRRGPNARTILITNLTQQQFGERYNDERLRSRMVQSAKWVKDKGGDMRAKGGE